MADAIASTAGHIQTVAQSMATLQENVQQNQEHIAELIDIIRQNPNPAQQAHAPVWQAVE